MRSADSLRGGDRGTAEGSLKAVPYVINGGVASTCDSKATTTAIVFFTQPRPSTVVGLDIAFDRAGRTVGGRFAVAGVHKRNRLQNVSTTPVESRGFERVSVNGRELPNV
jgi:hypothetical protein